MIKWTISTTLASATLLMTVIFGGNSLSAHVAALPRLPEEPALQPSATLTPTLPLALQKPKEEPTLPPVLKIPETATLPENPPEPVFDGLAEVAPGQQAMVYDAKSKRMLWCTGEGTEQLYPASITKLYTAWLALQHLEPETVVTAGTELSLVQKGSSVAYVGKNCRLTVEMLVEAMLLPSGNDASYVLAAAAGRAIAGDSTMDGIQAVQAFVGEMNREAERLGLQNTHFSNPDGYHAGAHYSCLADVAVIAYLALEEPVMKAYMTCVSDAVVFESGQHITWYNSNRLVQPESDYYVPGVLGMKTGYTEAAGYCLLAAYDLGETVPVIGIFGAADSTGRYEDAMKLLKRCQEA